VISIELIEQKCTITKFLSHPEQPTLTDGTNYLHVAMDATGKNIIDLMRYGKNDPEKMFEELFNVFGVMMISEYDWSYPKLAHPHTQVMTIKLEEKNQREPQIPEEES
jgi:hypothetical protein